MTVVGVVSELRRYPVKSMLGETLDELEIGPAGAAGDRVCALIDRETGKVASAKLPHRWRKPLEFKARLSALSDAQNRPLVELQMPNGARLLSDSADIDKHLSAVLEREVTLKFLRPDSIEIERARPDEIAKHGSTAMSLMTR